MHLPHLLVAGAALAVIGWMLAAHDAVTAPLTATPASTTTPPPPPTSNGHFVLVVEGDRNRLTITHASAKADPWAGVPTGFTSDWMLSIRDDRGGLLAAVPLDVSAFAIGAAEFGQAIQVEGCIVRDSRIAMLVNVPRFAEAAAYVFSRTAGGEPVALGTVDGNAVRELAGGGR